MSEAYIAETQRLVQAGFVVAIPEQNLTGEEESWFIPHHMVRHNEEKRCFQLFFLIQR